MWMPGNLTENSFNHMIIDDVFEVGFSGRNVPGTTVGGAAHD